VDSLDGQEKTMALTKQVVQDKIETVAVGDHKVIQVRTATKIVEDGEVISSSYHRHVLTPDADISGESAEVQAIATAVFTDTVKANYQTFLDNRE
jgi:hypothetical protein